MFWSLCSLKNVRTNVYLHEVYVNYSWNNIFFFKLYAGCHRSQLTPICIHVARTHTPLLTQSPCSTYRHSITDAVASFQNAGPSNFAPSHNWLYLHMVNRKRIRKDFSWSPSSITPKLIGRSVCYRPALFFRHLRLTELSLQKKEEEESPRILKTSLFVILITSFFFLNCVSLKLRNFKLRNLKLRKSGRFYIFKWLLHVPVLAVVYFFFFYSVLKLMCNEFNAKFGFELTKYFSEYMNILILLITKFLRSEKVLCRR